MSRKFVTNPWTEVPHGHARTELNVLKSLLLENKLNCSIISESRDFGDYFTEPIYHSANSRIWARNPFYTIARFLNNYRFLKFTIQRFKQLSEPEDYLIISSINFEQFLIASIFFGRNKLYLRVFNCPKDNLTKINKILLKNLIKTKRFKIGNETKEIAIWFETNFDLKTQIVPPLNRLLSDSNSVEEIKIEHQKPIIGIIYPVTSTFQQDEFREIVDIFREEKILVKFPAVIPIAITGDNFEIIRNGISDEQLIQYFKNMDFVVLMNHNYLNRGSGLLTLCMSLGKYIYVFDDNNFVETYKESYPLISIQTPKDIEEDFKINRYKYLDTDSKLKLSRKFVENVNLCWKSFLDVR